MRQLLLPLSALVCALCAFGSASGQDTTAKPLELRGVITDATRRTPIEFATLQLEPLDSAEGARPRGDIADLKGAYHFGELTVGQYVLTVRSLGYTPLVDTLTLEAPITERDYRLSASATELQSVTVEARRRLAEIDNRTFTFDKEDVRRATYARDLLLLLPNLVHDPVNDRLQRTEGGSLLILINGVRASEVQLRTIPPSKVRRVVYYDVPPACYASVGAVLDVITSELSTGFVAGGQLMHAVTTGFANDQFYAAATYGRHRFDASYNLSWRNYRDRRYHKTYRYHLQGVESEDHTEARDAFGYADHAIDLRYSYSGENGRVFQALFQPNYSKTWSSGRGQGFYRNGEQRIDRQEESQDLGATFSPSLDLYYSQRLGRGELSANLRGTLFDVQSTSYLKQTDTRASSPLVEDNMSLSSKKQTLIGEVDYSHRLGSLGALSGGYRGEYSWLTSDISNLFGRNHYASTIAQHYLYAELTGSQAALSYRLSLGVKHLSHQSPANTYQRRLITPQAMLGYRLGKGHQLRFEYHSRPIVPSVTQLSDNVSRLAPDLISVGNPHLESGIQHGITLRYTWEHKYFDLSINPMVLKRYAPIVQSFYDRSGFYALGYDNGVRSSIYQIANTVAIKPLGNNAVVLRGVFAPTYDEVQTREERYSVLGYRNRLSLLLSHKGWTLSYALRIPVYHLGDGFLSLEENTHNLFGTYQWRQWKFSVGMLFIGSPAHYESRSLPKSLVRFESDTDIYDNRNMLVFAVEYHFDSGKNREVRRKLHNRDSSGAPTF